MRLTCPNCGARYEVPDEVIPQNGRDVQCSNCGDTWFQQHPEQISARGGDDEEAAPFSAPPPRHEPTAGPAASRAPEPSRPETLAEDASESDWGDEDAPEPADPAPPQRPGVDPAVAEILRQEAAREQAARAALAAGAIETQPDLGLSHPAPGNDERGRQARDRIERLRGSPAGSVAGASVVPGMRAEIDPSTRRNLLPDIEEINSSLTAFDLTDEPETLELQDETERPAQRSGFGTGFRLAVLLFILGTTVYLLAPRIAGQFPAAEAPLAKYVQSVDAARLWLNAQASAAMGWVTKAAGPATGDGN